MPRLPRISFDGGTQVATVKVTGNPRNQEPESVRVEFPGGEVTITRARDGADADYWIHVSVMRPESSMYVKGESETGKITDARLDIHGKHAADCDAGDFGHPALYHVGLRVTRDGGK